MQTIFESCTPRSEVLQGQLSEELFAARLRDVIDGQADPVYQQPERFFANTWPTSGLRTLLSEVLGRLTGAMPTNSPIIRLETSFGGGKTHNLIALYHTASGKTSAESMRGLGLVGIPLPLPNEIDIAGVVGSDLDPANGSPHTADNITTHTLWGELAWQLGGRAGYALARESDLNFVAPGTSLFETIIGEKPTLILIDEIARHLRGATAVPTKTGGSNAAEQTVAFLMSLMEFVASKRRVVLVLTMASDQDAFGKETASVHSALTEAMKISARQERVLTPTGENEIASIVVHRLFEQIDRGAVDEIVAAYGSYYARLHEQSAAMHDRSLRGDYLQEFPVAYPFHPELIRILNLKVATIPNFQRTRGALRLLASGVRELWHQHPDNTWLIHPHHIDLSQPSLVEDLTSRLNRPKFKQVVEADIVSPQIGIPAHASEIDQILQASHRPPYARRLATTIFLHSLTQGIASGVELPELFLATATPAPGNGDDPAVMARALENLYDHAWFLEYDGYRYRFKTEPSLNKIVEDEIPHVGISRAKQEVEERVRKIWRAGFLKAVHCPSSPAAVDDDADKPKLVILHFDAVKVGPGQDAPPELLRRIYERTGSAESFRIYANNLLFLVADADQVDNMVGIARRYLAINRITGSTQRMREFSAEHQKELRKLGDSAELDVRVSITRAYRYLYYPSVDAPAAHAYLRRETMPPQDQGDTDQDQTNVVVRVLRNLQRVLTADDQVKAGAFVKSKAWDYNQTEMTTEELRQAFARKIGLPMLLDINQLKRSIENGVKSGSWLYYSISENFAYAHDSPPTLWQISDDARLYAPDAAARLGLRIKGKWTPPPSPGPEGESLASKEDDEPPAEALEQILRGGRSRTLRGHGVPNQAFQQLYDSATEQQVTAIERLSLRITGIESSRATDLAAMGLVIPQLGKAKSTIGMKLLLEFNPGEGVQINFQGGWERYQRLKQVSDALARDKERRQINLDFTLTVEFDDGLPLSDGQLGQLRDTLDSMGVGVLELTAQPATTSESL